MRTAPAQRKGGQHTFPLASGDDSHCPLFVLPSAAGPLSSFILPPMDGIVARERRYRAQMALFRAALAVVRGGPGSLKDVPDPFGDGPFEYRALDTGFELKSKLLYEGKPVTLTVGQGKMG